MQNGFSTGFFTLRVEKLSSPRSKTSRVNYTPLNRNYKCVERLKKSCADTTRPRGGGGGGVWVMARERVFACHAAPSDAFFNNSEPPLAFNVSHMFHVLSVWGEFTTATFLALY